MKSLPWKPLSNVLSWYLIFSCTGAVIQLLTWLRESLEEDTAYSTGLGETVNGCLVKPWSGSKRI